MNSAIHDSVGRGGNNHRHDVMTVQLLLNNARFADCLDLIIDGICGPKTLSAIVTHQQRARNTVYAEGIIHPYSWTLSDLLSISSINYRFLIRQVHQIQKMQSPSMYPVANVTQIAPLPRALEAALQTPETHLASSGQTGHKYTDSPLEMPRAGTKVDPLLLPDLLQRAWPDLNMDGARVITAQYMGETGGGKSCWNYNLGNVKCGEVRRRSHLHQYLPGTWEYPDAKNAEDIVRRNKNSRYATSEEIIRKVGKEKDGKRVVFFKPPDLECCFLAYRTLGDVLVEWTDKYKHIAGLHPDFLGKLNKGDCAGCAKILKTEGYYSNLESAYAAAMQKYKEELDRTLRPK